MAYAAASGAGSYSGGAKGPSGYGGLKGSTNSRGLGQGLYGIGSKMNYSSGPNISNYKTNNSSSSYFGNAKNQSYNLNDKNPYGKNLDPNSKSSAPSYRPKSTDSYFDSPGSYRKFDPRIPLTTEQLMGMSTSRPPQSFNLEDYLERPQTSKKDEQCSKPFCDNCGSCKRYKMK